MAYIAGTLLCRRWIPRWGLAGAVRRGAGFSAAAALAMAWLAITDSRTPLAVMAPMALYALGHGIHMPCGQAGAVGPFPKAAGLASALAGIMLASKLAAATPITGAPRTVMSAIAPATASAVVMST